MKKSLLILTVLIMGAVGSVSAEVVRNGESPKSAESTFRRSGNTFETVQSAKNTDELTPYTWKDKDGIIYPIYITKNGACYVNRISKKTGQEYKYYLPKEVQAQIRKELGKLYGDI